MPDIIKVDVNLLSMRNEGPGDNWAYQTLIKFDLSSVPEDAEIIDATLQLYYTDYKDNDPSGHEFFVYKNLVDWSEDTVTWNTQPSNSTEETTFAIVPSTVDSWMSWNVTKDVIDFISGETDNFGWKLIDESYSTDVDIPLLYFNSKENDDNQPVLEITYQLYT